MNVHYIGFKLKPETLFLTVNIIDRFLSKAWIKREQFQLLGVAALMIACKFEQVAIPKMKHFQ